MIDFSRLHYYMPSKRKQDFQFIKADLCIYGGTSAGVAAAIQGSRMGLQVVLISFDSHLGGLSAGGLGATDIGNKGAIGGISREFYLALGRHYGKEYSTDTDGSVWKFEPQIAEQIYLDWLQAADIEVYFEQHLANVEKSNGRITTLKMENGNQFSAEVYIDATYEGDLLAGAGVSYHVGREANSVYRETLNGIHFGHPNHNFKAWVDPFIVEGKPDSGLVIGVSDQVPGFQGDGDRCVQAYNFRICLTDVPENRIPFPEPPHYEPERFTLLARYIQKGVWDTMRLHIRMPNGKTDLNNYGGVSTDNIGLNYAWPDGSYETREQIFQDHVNYNLGLLYFLSHDEQVPKEIRAEVSQWGLPKDEFVATNGWPHQLYIREARRMTGDLVMTEQHCRGYDTIEDSIGLAAYTMDSHNCRRIVIDGRCINEGNVEVPPSAPYPISYRSIVPKGDECINLLVPVCLSASHIAYGSIRMEPVFMILGQSAATAAALAIEKNSPVQNIEYKALQSRLLADGQILAWKN